MKDFETENKRQKIYENELNENEDTKKQNILRPHKLVIKNRYWLVFDPTNKNKRVKVNQLIPLNKVTYKVKTIYIKVRYM